MYDRDDKYRITLDSANGTLTVHSDGTLNLNASKINIKAEKEFPLICEKSEVTVTKDMDTTVGNNVSFQAGKDFSVTAAGDNKNTAGKKIKLDGLEVDISALGSLKSSAKGTAELSAIGNTRSNKLIIFNICKNVTSSQNNRYAYLSDANTGSSSYPSCRGACITTRLSYCTYWRTAGSTNGRYDIMHRTT